MRYALCVAVLGAGMLMGADANKNPGTRSRDMQRAIAFERYKDLAAARQARKEARHPSVPPPAAENRADRSADRDTNTVRDPGPGNPPRR